MDAPGLDAETIARLAEAQGIPLADADMAERIAAGAGAAIAVVRAQLAAEADASGNPLWDFEPGEFAATLERLADEPDPPQRP